MLLCYQSIRRSLYSVWFASGSFLPLSTLPIGTNPTSLGLTESQPNKREGKLVVLDFAGFVFVFCLVLVSSLMGESLSHFWGFLRVGFPSPGVCSGLVSLDSVGSGIGCVLSFVVVSSARRCWCLFYHELVGAWLVVCKVLELKLRNLVHLFGYCILLGMITIVFDVLSYFYP